MLTKKEYLKDYYESRISYYKSLNSFANDGVRQWRDNKLKEFESRLNNLENDTTKVYYTKFVNKFRITCELVGIVEEQREHNYVDFRIVWSKDVYDIGNLMLMPSKFLNEIK